MPLEGRAPGVPHSDSLARPLEQYFDEGWAERDYRVKAIPLIKRRKVVIDSDFLTEEDLSADFFVFLAKFNLLHCALVKFHIQNDIIVCALHRSAQRTKFSTREAQGLSGLSEQLTLSSSVSRAISDAKASGVAEAFDHMRLGAVFLNKAGQVVRMNALAEGLMGPDLNVSRGEIRSRIADETKTLHRQIYALLRGNEVARSQNAVRISREGKRPLIILFQKADGILGDFFSGIKLIAIIHDLEDQPHDRGDLIQHTFGLTLAETAVALLLAQGENLRSIAEQRQVSYETARTHMKSLFSKMGARRQSEIVALITKVR